MNSSVLNPFIDGGKRSLIRMRPQSTLPWELIGLWTIVCVRLSPGSSLSFGGPEGLYACYQQFCFKYDFQSLSKNLFSVIFDPMLMAGELPSGMTGDIRPRRVRDTRSGNIAYLNLALAPSQKFTGLLDKDSLDIRIFVLGSMRHEFIDSWLEEFEMI